MTKTICYSKVSDLKLSVVLLVVSRSPNSGKKMSGAAGKLMKLAFQKIVNEEIAVFNGVISKVNTNNLDLNYFFYS